MSKIKKTTKFVIDKKHSGLPIDKALSEFNERYPDLGPHIRIADHNPKKQLVIDLEGMTNGLNEMHLVELAGLIASSKTKYKDRSDEKWMALNSLKEAIDHLKKSK